MLHCNLTFLFFLESSWRSRTFLFQLSCCIIVFIYSNYQVECAQSSVKWPLNYLLTPFIIFCILIETNFYCGGCKKQIFSNAEWGGQRGQLESQRVLRKWSDGKTSKGLFDLNIYSIIWVNCCFNPFYNIRQFLLFLTFMKFNLPQWTWLQPSLKLVHS